MCPGKRDASSCQGSRAGEGFGDGDSLACARAGVCVLMFAQPQEERWLPPRDATM